MSTRSNPAVGLRPFDNSARDYQALAHVVNAVWSDYPTTPELLKRDDQHREPNQIWCRLLAIEDNQPTAVCGFMQYPGAGNEGKYHINVNVVPDKQRRGIGTACYDALQAGLARIDHDRQVTRTREDQPGAIRFLTNRSFEQAQRNPMSRLDLTRFDPGDTGLPQGCPDGIRILSLADLLTEVPDWQVRCEALEWAIDQDVPSPEPAIRLAFDVYKKRFTHPSFRPDAWFLALDGNDWVGMTTLWPHPPTPERLYTGLTGVLRSHRRRHIATALKLRAFQKARALGFGEIEADNEENNPMLSLNLRLGFVEHPAWLVFRKQV